LGERRLQEKIMIRKSTISIVVLALAFGAASPGFAKARTLQSNDWRNARAQAIPDSDMSLNRDRAAAIRDCNGKAASLREYTWGEEQDQRYRSCMAEHGQME
jgi:hypothetical protein